MITATTKILRGYARTYNILKHFCFKSKFQINPRKFYEAHVRSRRYGVAIDSLKKNIKQPIRYQIKDGKR